MRKGLKLLYSFKADRQMSHKSLLPHKHGGARKHDQHWPPPSTTNLTHQFFIFSFSQIRSQCFHRPLLTPCSTEQLLPAQFCFPFLPPRAIGLSVVVGREEGALVCSSKAASTFFPLNFSYKWHMTHKPRQSVPQKAGFHQTALTSAMEHMQKRLEMGMVRQL